MRKLLFCLLLFIVLWQLQNIAEYLLINNNKESQPVQSMVYQSVYEPGESARLQAVALINQASDAILLQIKDGEMILSLSHKSNPAIELARGSVSAKKLQIEAQGCRLTVKIISIENNKKEDYQKVYKIKTTVDYY